MPGRRSIATSPEAPRAGFSRGKSAGPARRSGRAVGPATLAAESGKVVARALRVLHEKTRFRFAGGDRLRAALAQRIVLNDSDPESYLRLLRGSATEAHQLAHALLGMDLGFGATTLHRSAARFVTAGAARTGRSGLRVWNPACGTGEEAYSIALALADFLPRASRQKLRIFANDVDEQSLDIARHGIYAPERLAGLTERQRRSYFEDLDGTSARVAGRLRERIVFASLNVFSDPPISDLDFICCRNLLRYLEPGLAGGLVEVFSRALVPGGFLLLDAADPSPVGPQFEAASHGLPLYRAREHPGPRRPVAFAALATPPAGEWLGSAPADADETHASKDVPAGGGASNPQHHSRAELKRAHEQLDALNQEIATATDRHRESGQHPDAPRAGVDQLLFGSDTPVLVASRDETLRRFTAAAASLFDMSHRDIGRPIRQLRRRFADDAFEADLTRVRAEALVVDRHVRSDDGRWYLRRIMPHRSRGERADGTLVTFTDVTALKRTLDALSSDNWLLANRISERTAELQRERNFASTVLDTIGALVVVLDRSFCVVRWNQTCAELSGRPAQEVVGRRIWDLGLIPDDQVETMRRVMRRLCAGETLILREGTWRGAGGDMRRIAWTNTVVRNADGEVVYIVGSGIDVTDQRKAESDAQQNQAALLHVQRTMAAGELAGALAHEVNQPLSAIANLSVATLRQLEGLGVRAGQVTENLEKIAAQARRAGHVIHELRAFVGRSDVKRTAVDLNAVIRSARDLVQPEASRLGISIKLHLGDEPLLANAVAVHLEQTLVNLMQNSIDALRDSAGRSRSIRVSARAGARRTLQIRVADNAKGLGGEATAHAFEPFFTTKAHGLGLGLAISRSAIEANGGTLRLESTGPHGSVFRIELPRMP